MTSVAALLTAVSALVASVATLVKILGELRRLKGTVDHAARSADLSARRTADVRHEVLPNGGGSLRDSITRTEGRVAELARDLGGLRADLRDERADRREADEHTLTGKRLAHAQIWAAIEQLKRRQP